mmetsp:Transcript_26630/g.23597  ORF Transcript_26630/g.23597 Transcript_26630/m.23597 type:complete len:169 (+) Transcript_26630:38-544(+)
MGKRDYTRLDTKDHDESGIESKRQKEGQLVENHITYKDTKYIPYERNLLLESPIYSSLSLQKLLYYNKYLDFMLLYIILIASFYKLFVFKTHIILILRPVLLAPWAFLEYSRFNTGNFGNLKETFADLFSFILLSVFALGIQLASLALDYIFPIDQGVLIVYVIFVIF